MLQSNYLCRDDSKRSDGLTALTWANGRWLVWEFTCSETLAVSHSNHAVLSPGEVANDAMLSMVVQREDAACVLGTVPAPVDLTNFFIFS